jgi:hypothetical protein
MNHATDIVLAGVEGILRAWVSRSHDRWSRYPWILCAEFDEKVVGHMSFSDAKTFGCYKLHLWREPPTWTEFEAFRLEAIEKLKALCEPRAQRRYPLEWYR